MESVLDEINNWDPFQSDNKYYVNMLVNHPDVQKIDFTSLSQSTKDKLLILSCRYNILHLVIKCLDNGSNPLYQDSQCLIEACRCGSFLIVKKLFHFGVNIHGHEDLGFLLSCQKGCLNIVQLFIEVGSLNQRINLENNQGQAAWLCNQSHNFDLLFYLHRKGCCLYQYHLEPLEWCS